MKYILLTLLWLSFFLAHSILASLKVKDRITGITGISARNYRLIYVIFSLLHLLVLIVFSASVESRYFITPSDMIKYSGLILASLGVIVVMRAFKSYDGKAFFGLSDLEGEKVLHTEGLLRYVRHPLYSGSIVLLIGFLLYIPKVINAISVVLMIAYFLIGIRFEEKKLVEHFGDRYKSYRSKTPMLIPRIFS